MEKIITRKDEEIFLKSQIADNMFFNNPFTFNEIIECINKKEIRLEINEDDGTKIIDEEHFNEIKKVIPFLLKIIDKPRSFIKSLEEKVPIETAKKINFKAISKLSRDSNDWHARTLLTVKPKNIIADINEETIDLYENRFVCTLIDKIDKLIMDRYLYYEKELNLFYNNKATFSMDKDYHTTGRFSFYNKITKKKNNNTDYSYEQKIIKERDDVVNIQNKIRIMKRSSFYTLLHKYKKVSDPIKKTNILMFDVNYNKAYKLWIYLNSYRKEEKLTIDIQEEYDDLQTYYCLYSLLCIFSALYDLKFKEVTNNKIQYNKNKIKFDDTLIFKKDNDVLELNYNNNKIEFGYRYDNNIISTKDKLKNKKQQDKKHETDRFILYPDFIDFTRMSRTEIDEFTANKLNEFIDNDRFSKVSSRYSLFSLDMQQCECSDKVYKRFYSIGNNLSSEEKIENLQNWGNYKSGFIILSPINLESTFLRLEKIINFHMLKHKDFSSLANCPLCGSKYITKRNTNDYICNSCKHSISITFCNNCDKGRTNPIKWIKYIDEKFLNSDDIKKGLPENIKIYDRLNRIEWIMGKDVTTAFEFEQEHSGLKLKTICPRCGKKLGENI